MVSASSSLKDSGILIVTSGQKIWMKGCIAILSPLTAPNGFIPWAHISQPPKWHLDRLVHFLHTPQQSSNAFQRADNPKITQSPWGLWTPNGISNLL